MIEFVLGLSFGLLVGLLVGYWQMGRHIKKSGLATKPKDDKVQEE